MSHTPGPWRTAIRRGYISVFSGTENNAEMVADCSNLNLEVKERIANARLMAAAPELLDALRKIGDIVPWVHNASVTDDIEALRGIAEAYAVWHNTIAAPAIAKATGQ